MPAAHRFRGRISHGQGEFMPKKKSLFKNYFYNLALNIFNILFPLITSPYVSRILGAVNVGKVGFATSFSAWFVTIASIGIPTYGIREISKVHQDREKLDKVFSELLILQMTSTLICMALYVASVVLYPKTRQELPLFLVMGGTLLLNMISMDWFYQGIQEYGYITARSVLFKLISLVLIFALIHHRQDYVIYGSISVFALSFSNVLNYFHSRKFVTLNFRSLNMKPHLQKLKVFFLSSLVVSIFSLFDQVFVSILSNYKEVAFYSRGRQMVNMALSLTMSLSTILIPRSSYLFNTDLEKYKHLLSHSLNYIYIMAIPCAFGIAGLSRQLMLFIGGGAFLPGAPTLLVMSLLVIIISVNWWQFDQVLVPSNHEKMALVGQIGTAVGDVVLNLLLIPRLGSIGAGIAIVCAEIVGLVIGMYVTIKQFQLRYLTPSLIRYLGAAIVMSGFIQLIKYLIHPYLMVLVISVAGGAALYFLILRLFREAVVDEIFHATMARIRPRQ